MTLVRRHSFIQGAKVDILNDYNSINLLQIVQMLNLRKLYGFPSKGCPDMFLSQIYISEIYSKGSCKTFPGGAQCILCKGFSAVLYNEIFGWTGEHGLQKSPVHDTAHLNQLFIGYKFIQTAYTKYFY